MFWRSNLSNKSLKSKSFRLIQTWMGWKGWNETSRLSPEMQSLNNEPAEGKQLKWSHPDVHSFWCKLVLLKLYKNLPFSIRLLQTLRMTSSCNRHKQTSTVDVALLLESPEIKISWSYAKAIHGTDLCYSKIATILLSSPIVRMKILQSSSRV